jgi:hypothetical protein
VLCIPTVLASLSAKTPPPGKGEVWERSEFIIQSALNTACLGGLLDDVLADTFVSVGALCSNVISLYRTLEDHVDFRSSMKLADLAFQISQTPSLTPSQVAQVCTSAEFRELEQLYLSAWFCDESYWKRESVVEVKTWLGTLTPTQRKAIETSPCYPTLLQLAQAHMRLSLWPFLVDSNVMWRVKRCLAGSVPLDHAQHHLFSLGGNPPPEGTLVFPCGPVLQGREPWGLRQKKGGTQPSAASPADLAEFIGAKCRELVVSN